MTITCYIFDSLELAEAARDQLNEYYSLPNRAASNFCSIDFLSYNGKYIIIYTTEMQEVIGDPVTLELPNPTI